MKTCTRATSQLCPGLALRCSAHETTFAARQRRRSLGDRIHPSRVSTGNRAPCPETLNSLQLATTCFGKAVENSPARVTAQNNRSGLLMIITDAAATASVLGQCILTTCNHRKDKKDSICDTGKTGTERVDSCSSAVATYNAQRNSTTAVDTGCQRPSFQSPCICCMGRSFGSQPKGDSSCSAMKFCAHLSSIGVATATTLKLASEVHAGKVQKANDNEGDASCKNSSEKHAAKDLQMETALKKLLTISHRDSDLATATVTCHQSLLVAIAVPSVLEQAAGTRAQCRHSMAIP